MIRIRFKDAPIRISWDQRIARDHRMKMMRSMFMCSIGLLLMTAQAAHAQQFELSDSTGRRVGVAELSRSGLSVQQAAGNQIRYRRAIDYDSSDGQFIGFFHRRTARALRFPMTGRGRLFLADLNQPVPRFLGTGRFVRPLVGPPDPWIIHPHAGPWPTTPLVYGYDLAPHLDPSIIGFQRAEPLRRSYLVESQTVANPPLPPVEVQLFNDGARDIQVQVNDLIEPGKRQAMRIQPQTAVIVKLQRDPGGQEIKRYKVYLGYGEWTTRETTYPVPSPTRYEIVVHEWTMQSIAIDRTGKSPNKIEDVQYQGRGIGRFLLPPGDQLQAGVIGVYSAAQRQGNQGTVAPILPQERSSAGQLSPLERVLLETQR
ncbi:MAG: hypothetical protein P8L85_01435 [Rubripirellula sp.]|nr:hypothetical protein [Rubripirellula sp.]